MSSPKSFIMLYNNSLNLLKPLSGSRSNGGFLESYLLGSLPPFGMFMIDAEKPECKANLKPGDYQV